MILFKRAHDLSEWLQQQRNEGRTIGFVPTMGALHAGHISLIDISKKTTEITVCSIFVNPTQFNDPRDFLKYPVTIETDIYILEQAGTDVLFMPAVEDLYPGGTGGLEHYDLGKLDTMLEGKYRPGHFQGVCQVMRRLLDSVLPDDLFMGRKDYQQCMVVRRLLDLTGSSTRLHPCPIVREADGLAMSSRNMRLTKAERQKAPAIYRALSLLKEHWKEVPNATENISARGPEQARKTAAEALFVRTRAILEDNGFRIDYIEVADAVTLEPVLAEDDRRTGAPMRTDGPGTGKGGAVVALVAAFLGEIRLIDNMIL